MAVEEELRLWSVDISRKPRSERFGYRSNRTIYVVAPSLSIAIEEALNELREDDPNAWAVSAGHKGPVHKIVTNEKDK